ncbi:MAG: hypothetical protein WCQ41_09050 [Bacillota bacterium]
MTFDWNLFWAVVRFLFELIPLAIFLGLITYISRLRKDRKMMKDEIIELIKEIDRLKEKI